jgi:hypothetical protein
VGGKMLIGLVSGFIVWLVSKSIFWAIVTGYLCIGAWKSYGWQYIARIRPGYLPPLINKPCFTHFVFGVIFWLIIIIGNRGDPAADFYKQ